MTVKGVLFDFSGTLFRIESTASWLRSVLDRARIPLDGAEFERLTRGLEAVGALPGGGAPRAVPAHLTEVWAERDRTAAQHRAAYTGMAREVPLPRPELYDALYARHMEPAAWRPYADAGDVLAELRRRGVRTAVVSNIGWDPRPVFREHGLDAWVDAYVLSYEHGVQKPDPRLFRAACEVLDLAPEDVLMVGDDRRADAGAAEVGCAVHLVDHLPVEERPDALRPVLELAG
ncbi:HAD-IA family hydrolase [Streptomyces netropsis]|uniref:Putative hydrolase of the HAD superfamily n=1 Tax=Streptomyces netropsis TaxID=55404 RepID=A0A7W7PCI5_STRNE|nr:HAD-IA family hydrolase [Streptomyces netropsis]MBB4885064.1 putative hydrolase of the HAD superfamily [Streptomyces netropsis]GGR26497.1 hydrolase [Streptomyces netropsis]